MTILHNMAKSIKKHLLFSILITLFISVSFADNSLQQTGITCNDIHFDLEGIQNTVLNQTHKYTINVQYDLHSTTKSPKISTEDITNYIIQNSKISFSIYYDKKLLQTIKDKSFYYAFDKLGHYILRANIDYMGCEYIIEKNIKVFDTSYVYMGSFLDEFNFGILENIEQYNKLLHTFIISDTTTEQDSFVSSLEQQISYFHNTKDIFINLGNYGLVFDTLHILQSKFGIDFENKNIFIITNSNKSIVKKFLVKFVAQSGIKSIYVITKKEFDDIIFNLSIDKPPYDEQLLLESSMDFDKTSANYTFSYIIDYLIFHGFPLDLIQILLTISIAVLLIVFCKQVIGLSSFGVYYPILFGISLHAVGTKTTFGLLIIAFLSKMFVSMLTKRVNILATAKMGLYIIAYIFLSLIGLRAYKLGIQHSSFIIFTNPMILIVYISILMVGVKLWNKTLPFKKLSRRKDLVWFFVLSTLIYQIINSEYLHKILLLYPGLILLCILLVFFIGNFIGLQLLEYLRFRPLIKYLRQHKK